MMYRKLKGLAIDGENVATVYLIEIKNVSLFVGGPGAAVLHYIPENKRVIGERRKPLDGLCY